MEFGVVVGEQSWPESRKVVMPLESKGEAHAFTVKELLEQLDGILNSEYIRKTNQDKKQAEIAFAISLKSKTVSRDWAKVQTNLSRTMRSILGNTDQHFRILVAGHEKPEIGELQNDRVTWLPVDFPPPVATHELSADKMHKRRVIGANLREQGYSGYFMPIDADDWVHYRFVEFIRTRPVSDVFIVSTGLMVNLMRKEVWLRGRFYRGCGSSAVYNFANDDFPIYANKKDVRKTFFDLTVGRHSKIDQNLEKINKEYTMVNFPFISYVLGHGDNNSTLKGRRNENGMLGKEKKVNGEPLDKWIFNYFKIGK